MKGRSHLLLYYLQRVKDIFFNLTKIFFIKIKASSNNVKMSCPSLADSRVSDGA